MISTLIFDLGDVLVDVKKHLIISNLQNELGNHFDPEKIEAGLRSSSAIKAYELGSLNSDLFYQALNSELGLALSKDTLKKCWQNIFDAIHDNVSLLPILKQNYELAMISDTNPWHIEIIDKQFDILEHFTVKIFSYQVNIKKPDPRMFEIALERVQAAPETCVYIDDMKTNVEAAETLGMRGIHYKTHSKLVEELLDFGVKI